MKQADHMKVAEYTRWKNGNTRAVPKLQHRCCITHKVMYCCPARIASEKKAINASELQNDTQGKKTTTEEQLLLRSVDQPYLTNVRFLPQKRRRQHA